uniref:Uncharacterized protein n=1 Tax=Arundo donax TaxID=35708 RepID=A0A0A8Y7D9_ARUDO
MEFQCQVSHLLKIIRAYSYLNLFRPLRFHGF